PVASGRHSSMATMVAKLGSACRSKMRMLMMASLGAAGSRVRPEDPLLHARPHALAAGGQLLLALPAR
ncbi:MAG: hypothetical protein ACREJ0_21060, partial [Geminicoccaceae bacterium]